MALTASDPVPAPRRTLLGPTRLDDELLRWVRTHTLCVAALVVAVTTRLAFWIFTGRVWEDAAITVATARNFWDGNGLVHHVTDRVQSFSSPIGLLPAIAGEGFGHALGVLRLASLCAAVATILLASRLATTLRLSTWAQILLLGFLALDQLQVFFGMAGMETQLATAILFANVVATVERRWAMLGWTTALAVLVRPEYVIWAAIATLWVALLARDRLLAFLARAAVVPALWFTFTWWYYGSPVPHTIVAKRLVNPAPIAHLGTYISENWWVYLAPFREWFFTTSTPIPETVLKLTALVAFVLGVTGIVRSCVDRRLQSLVPVAAFIVGFFIYRSVLQVSTYATWYVVPFVALFVVFAAVGLDWLTQRSKALSAGVTVALVLMFAVPTFWSWPLERRIQRDIETHVRAAVGEYLATNMRPGDSVALEPPGFMGLALADRNILDFPGITSGQAANVLERRPPSERLLATLVVDAKPEWVVMRPKEVEWFELLYPEVAAEYDEVARFAAPPGLSLSFHGLQDRSIDTRFVVLRRATT